MTGAMGLAAGLSEEAKSFLKAQAAKLVAEMDLVGRDEFETAKQMAADARAEADDLRQRLEALERLVNKRS
jgi:BMFP domain-containing protein YqiC